MQHHAAFHEPVGAKLFQENIINVHVSLLQITKCHFAYLRSLHTQSEIFVRNFRTLKNKYDLTLCQSRLHTLPPKLSSVKKNSVCNGLQSELHRVKSLRNKVNWHLKKIRNFFSVSLKHFPSYLFGGV